MKQYSFNVNGQSQVGNMGWNSNGTLGTFGVTDPFGQNNQNCTYSYDGFSRVAGVNCGSVWAQTFGYDAFGNLTKSGSISWQPGYDPSTNHYTLGGTSYDADGNLLNDTFNTYTWNVYGGLAQPFGEQFFIEGCPTLVAPDFGVTGWVFCNRQRRKRHQ